MTRDELLDENHSLLHQLADLKRRRSELRKRLAHELNEARLCLDGEPNIEMCRSRINQAIDALRADLL